MFRAVKNMLGGVGLVMLSSAVTLVLISGTGEGRGSPPGDPVVAESPRPSATAEDAKRLLQKLLDRIRSLEQENLALKNALDARHEVLREVVIDELNTAHPLIEPRLLLSVSMFGREGAQAQWGETGRYLPVGGLQRFEAEGRDCFLVLRAVEPSRAVFGFGCSS